MRFGAKTERVAGLVKNLGKAASATGGKVSKTLDKFAMIGSSTLKKQMKAGEYELIFRNAMIREHKSVADALDKIKFAVCSDGVVVRPVSARSPLSVSIGFCGGEYASNLELLAAVVWKSGACPRNATCIRVVSELIGRNGTFKPI